LRILSNVPVVEIGNTKIEQYVKQERKIKNSKVKSKIACANHILHSSVNAKNPQGFYEQVQKQKKAKIGKEFSLHQECRTI
jgi:uncharacterized protein (UPF0179 family)